MGRREGSARQYIGCRDFCVIFFTRFINFPHLFRRFNQPVRAKIKQIEIGGVSMRITRRKTRSLRVAVHPPSGDVRVSVPGYVSNFLVEQFILERLDWIKDQRAHFLAQPQPVFQQLVSGECIGFWGQDIPLEVVERPSRHGASLLGSEWEKQLVLKVKPGSSPAERRKVLDAWYRAEMKKVIPGFIAKWQPVVGVTVEGWGVRQMKTRWGTCNITDRRIWLNLELVKMLPVCLDYVIVHEMTHLLERLHNKRFWQLLDRFMPDWRSAESLLKQSEAR